MFSAAHKLPNNKLYFFEDEMYWRFDLGAGKADRGYPKRIADHWQGVPRNPDAIIEGQGDRADKVYFFKGRRYWRYDLTKRRTDPGYPQNIATHWPGLWPQGVDACFLNPINNKMYFFRGRQYIRFDFAKGKKDDGYPLSVSANWRGLQGPFDAVLMGTGDRKDKVYFFQDHRYWRYDLKTHRTDRGYPKDTRPLWPGLGFSIAEQAIRAFEQKSTPGKWPQLSRAILAQEMRDTLEDPWRINQASTPMCGPACILYGLASQRPRDYVRLVADLYDKGSHRMKTKTMRPSADVMGSAASHGTRQVDWLTMAGMRDAANVIFTIDGNEGWSQNIEQGIAFPWEIEGWAKELLRLRNVKVDTTFVWGDEEILQKGDLAHRRGGISILLVDAAMARNESAFPAVPNHYVVYEGNLDIERRPFWQGDMYRFRVWTWGTRPRGIAQKDSHFDGNMFGAIYGDP